MTEGSTVGAFLGGQLLRMVPSFVPLLLSTVNVWRRQETRRYALCVELMCRTCDRWPLTIKPEPISGYRLVSLKIKRAVAGYDKF